jgi:glycogen phosphorylase
MSFQIRPLKEFLVKPALPPALSRLPELGLNLMWSWHHAQRAVFRRLDPVIWKASNHNPVIMLGRLPQETLEKAARDPRFLALYHRACESLDSYMAAQNTTASNMLVAYFRWSTVCSIA